jgi:ComF family protein
VIAWGRGLARATLDLLLPATCPACDRLLDDGEPGLVCGRCWTRLAPLPHPQCARCGHPSRPGNCAWCALLPSHVRAARSVCWVHRGTGREIVHALKYDRWHAVATGIADRMARLSWPNDVIRERTAVIPVPLADVRLRERGFNQSERLATALAERWRVPVWRDVLARSRSTKTQTRLTPDQRLANVSGAFRVHDASGFLRGRNAHVVLVDDVVTTAATLNACAAALVAGGARIVSYVTFGRAPAAGDR